MACTEAQRYRARREARGTRTAGKPVPPFPQGGRAASVLAVARDVGLGRDEHDEESEDNDSGEHEEVFQ